MKQMGQEVDVLGPGARKPAQKGKQRQKNEQSKTSSFPQQKQRFCWASQSINKNW